jgi:hypothetical protein
VTETNKNHAPTLCSAEDKKVIAPRPSDCVPGLHMYLVVCIRLKPFDPVVLLGCVGFLFSVAGDVMFGRLLHRIIIINYHLRARTRQIAVGVQTQSSSSTAPGYMLRYLSRS